MEPKILADKLGITLKRLATIAKALFDEEKAEFTELECTQIKAVVEYMQQKNEASVKKAVELWRQSSTELIRHNPRNSSILPITSAQQKEGISELSQQHFEMAKKRAIKQAVAIQETSQILLANFLENGIPLDELSEADLDALEVASEKVYDAALGKYDAAGNYLPALAQPARMLSAAID